MQRNVASQKLIVYVFDATTNLPKTGDAANLTAYVAKDWGTVTVLGDTSATETDSTNAKGFYLFDLTQGETDGATLQFTCKSSTANMVCLCMPAVVQTVPSAFSTTVPSTLTQSQVTGGAYALNSASFAFDAALDFTTTQKAATLARVTLVDTTTTNTDMRGTNSAALAATALSTAQWTNTLATNLGTTNTTVAANLDVASSTLATASNLAVVAGYLDTEIAAIKAKTDNLPASPAAVSDIPTAAANADAVWDEVLAGHLTGGSTGSALNSAGSAGDPWGTALPGAYTAGSAGFILGTNLDATVSSRGTSTLTQTQVTGGAYAINSASFAFNAALDFTTAQKAATLARVTLVDTTTTLTNLPTAPTDWVTALSVSAAAVTKIQTGLATPTNITAATGIVLSGVTHTGAVIPTVSAVTGLTASNLDTTVSSRLAAASYTAPPSAATNATAVRSELTTELARIDVAISTRSGQTSVDDLPTNAELATALAAADDAILAAVAGVQSDTNDIQTRLPAALTAGGNMKSDMLALNGSTTAAANAATAWGAIETGAAQGGTFNTVTLRAGATSEGDLLVGQAIFMTSGTSAGQTNTITDYNATTKVCTVETTWVVIPVSGDGYQVFGRVG